MHGAWVEFVRTHQAPWPRWSADGVAMVFDRESAVRPAFALERRVADSPRRAGRTRGSGRADDLAQPVRPADPGRLRQRLLG